MTAQDEPMTNVDPSYSWRWHGPREFPCCPKCRTPDPDIEWRPAMETVAPVFGIPDHLAVAGSYDFAPCHEGEHFHITCSRCRYMWTEAVG